MKTRFSRSLIFILLLTFLLLPEPTGATPPRPLVIHADLYLTGADSAAGTFTTSEFFKDTGSASEVFFLANDTIHGEKTLISTNGTITIKFQAKMTWTSATTSIATGRFVVLAGTGAYEKLHCTGETYAELDLAAMHLTATYTGMAHFD